MFFSAALVAVALSSCSKNEITTTIDDAPQAIGFGTYVYNPSTKATVETAFQADDIFVIDAYYTAQESAAVAMGSGKSAAPAYFMQNQKVVAAGTTDITWSYSPVKYWPNNDGDKVSFFAVTNATSSSPISDFDALVAEKAPSFKVTGAKTDIMIASLLDETKTADAINFNFAHVMAQVKFNVKLAAAIDSSTSVKIKSLTVDYGDNNTVNGGTFTYDLANENQGVWSNGTGSRANDVFSGEVLVNTGVSTIGAPLMIIPTTGASYDVTVVYQVSTIDGNNNDNYSIITNTCTFAISPESMNKVYTYALEIGLTKVEVSGQVSGWDATDAGTTVKVESTNGTVKE